MSSRRTWRKDRFGASVAFADLPKGEREAVRNRNRVVSNIAVQVAKARNGRAIEEAGYDPAPANRRVLALRVAVIRNAGPEELAYVLDGVETHCEAGAQLSDPAVVGFATSCLDLLGEAAEWGLVPRR